MKRIYTKPEMRIDKLLKTDILCESVVTNESKYGLDNKNFEGYSLLDSIGDFFLGNE